MLLVFLFVSSSFLFLSLFFVLLKRVLVNMYVKLWGSVCLRGVCSAMTSKECLKFWDTWNKINFRDNGRRWSKKFHFLRNIINERPHTDWDDKLFSYSLVANDAGPTVILKNEVRPPAACGRLLEFISVSIAFNHWIFMILLSLEFFAWLLLNFNGIIATWRGSQFHNTANCALYAHSQHFNYSLYFSSTIFLLLLLHLNIALSTRNSRCTMKWMYVSMH